MSRWVIRILTIAVMAVVLWYAGQYYCSNVLRHRTEINYMKALAERIKQCKASDVETVLIFLDSAKKPIALNQKDDRADISRLINSLRHITVEDRERNLKHGTSGHLFVKLKKHTKSFRGFKIEGDFDPDDAPIITRSMRSDDLGQIVHDIFEHKGINPKADEGSL